ncbi:GTP3C3 [Lepeophtheirus salmonis]|uniref:GTP3C3 n=1 Tax=Lepeophtheirus salmonis TaxID=72036 RepID=A0A7R8D7L4_LEPSM|nr:GTP3C3 [Lepeophtheirus salmonis]CAF3028131.1 GTP3C3 [Lepeophtheirus salmonis]
MDDVPKVSISETQLLDPVAILKQLQLDDETEGQENETSTEKPSTSIEAVANDPNAVREQSDEEELSSELEENNEDEDEKDEEWIPETKKSKVSEIDDPNSEAETDHCTQFEKEMDQTSRQQLGKKKKRVGVRTRRRKLDPALQGLIGEANLRFARGDKETAIRMCMEVIRQDPTVPEPFQTLAALYDENGEAEKSLQFSLIAAHLAPQDPEEWARLADLSLELGDQSQAAACYRKAIDAEPENPRYHLARCELLEQLGEMKIALRGYKRFIQVLRDDQGKDFLHGSKEIARILHQKGDVEEAKNIIETAFKKTSGLYTLDILCSKSIVKFSSDLPQNELEDLSPEKQLQSFNKVVIPEDTPLDIRAKLIIVLINLKACHLVKDDLSNELLNSNVEEFGDLMLDVAEAYMNQEKYDIAEVYLKQLVQSNEFNKAAVWLFYGEALFKLGHLEEAEKAYQLVVDLAPQHCDAPLSILTQDKAELLDSSLLYERCQLLFSEGQTEEFIDKAKMLFNRHFINIRNRDELHAIASAKKLVSKNRALSEVRAFYREPIKFDEGPSFQEDNQIELSDEFELFRKLCVLLHNLKRYDELQRLTFSALGSPHFNKKLEHSKELTFYCLISSFRNGDSYHAYNIVRELVVKNIDNHRVWNLFNLVIMRADDVRHNRFLMRLMSRHPDNLALGILNGHNCLVAGTYKYSLGEYMSAFRQAKTNPMIAMMLGLAYTHMACQKFSAKKHSLVVQAIAFLNVYMELRGPCQESYYNLGRAMHQLGLLPNAVFYYKKTLALKSAIPENNNFDLKREAAYNLSLIYQNSGNEDLVRHYIHKYIVI